MEISDGSYIITFVSKGNFGDAYNTVIFDPGPNGSYEAVDKFIVDYRKAHPEYTTHTQRLSKTAKRYSLRKIEGTPFDRLYEVIGG